jgi:branched-chain amino acid transport system permease protein
MLGGVGTVAGPVIGAALFLLLEQTVWANFLSVHALVLGVLVVLLALFLPRGVLGSFRPGQRQRRGEIAAVDKA